MAIKVAGNTVINDNKVFLPNSTAEVSASASISSGVLTLDLNTATAFAVSLTSNITSLVLQNVQSSGRTSSFVIIFTADGNTRAVSWPSSFKWPGGVAPTITATLNKIDVYTFFTTDGGSTWQAFISGQNL